MESIIGSIITGGLALIGVIFTVTNGNKKMGNQLDTEVNRIQKRRLNKYG